MWKGIIVMYKFKKIDKLEDFLLTNIDADLIIPSHSKDEVVFFQNGDKMTVNLNTGVLVWEPLSPGEMFTSKLSMRLHQWFASGIIYNIRSFEK